MKILITGGAGYIGAHTILALRQRLPHADLVIVDRVKNAQITQLLNSLSGTVLYYEMNLCVQQSVTQLFQAHSFDAVLHFAADKNVSESITNPLKYYENNVISTLHIVKACVAFNVRQLIFSSSATVYGAGHSPLKESATLLPTTNPYGETKLICERILSDASKAHDQLTVVLLRYFNPVGAHPSGMIGEISENQPNNLMPYITQVAKQQLPNLSIFGGDYPTADGTCIRDYIHVMDLAEGHVAALTQTLPGVHTYNLGTGYGVSVLQLVQAFEETNQVAIPYDIVARRPGDIAVVYADVNKARQELRWQANRTITQMCQDAWHFEQVRFAF